MTTTVNPSTEPARRYRMSKRLADQEATRTRIVEAAVDLHGSVGPAHTTISAIADHAGVQRSTVYRHFADDEAIFAACTAHWLAENPWPDPSSWAAVADPPTRLRRALGELYRHYDRNTAMIGNSWRDLDAMPAFVGEGMHNVIAEMVATLHRGWGLRGRRSRALRAAIVHAVAFSTWRSLTGDAGLSTPEAAGLAAAMVEGVAAPEPMR